MLNTGPCLKVLFNMLVHKLITLQKQSSVFCKKNVLNVCNVLSAFYAPKLSAVQ